MTTIDNNEIIGTAEDGEAGIETDAGYGVISNICWMLTAVSTWKHPLSLQLQQPLCTVLRTLTVHNQLYLHCPIGSHGLCRSWNPTTGVAND